jgi:hypothetical protein
MAGQLEPPQRGPMGAGSGHGVTPRYLRSAVRVGTARSVPADRARLLGGAFGLGFSSA